MKTIRPAACLDFESVIVPELWPHVAKRSGIPELNKTTRDVPDFKQLMAYRLDLVAQHNLTLKDLVGFAGELEPIAEGAKFLSWLRARMPVVLASDIAYQLAQPLLEKLDYPVMFSTYLSERPNGALSYDPRVSERRKARTVEALQSLNFYVLSCGDSFNDIDMLEVADYAVLFQPNEQMSERFPDLDTALDHAELRRLFELALGEPVSVHS